MVGTAQERLYPPYGLSGTTAASVIARSFSSEAIQTFAAVKVWIASLRSQ